MYFIIYNRDRFHIRTTSIITRRSKISFPESIRYSFSCRRRHEYYCKFHSNYLFSTFIIASVIFNNNRIFDLRLTIIYEMVFRRCPSHREIKINKLKKF